MIKEDCSNFKETNDSYCYCTYRNAYTSHNYCDECLERVGKTDGEIK